MVNPQVTCIIGGQYGSEGKGVICGYLANEYDIAVRVGAPNAGHTLKVGDNIWKMQQIPVAGLVNPDCVLLIGAAGLINLEILKREMGYIKDLEGRFFIDRNAGILEPFHREAEEKDKMFEGIGSTCEGVGAALRHKIQRNKQHPLRTAKDVPELEAYVLDVAAYLNNIAADKKVMIEGTQGHGLSLNHGPYPYCTGRDVLASSLLSDVGLSPFVCKEVIMVLRTYPIRVAGNSGPMFDEIDWNTVTKESGSPTPLTEQTTVTKRTRRIGRFNMVQVKEAVQMNRPTSIVLTFADYLTHEDHGKTRWDELSDKTKGFVSWLSDSTGVRIDIVKTGLEFNHICDRRKR